MYIQSAYPMQGCHMDGLGKFGLKKLKKAVTKVVKVVAKPALLVGGTAAASVIGASKLLGGGKKPQQVVAPVPAMMEPVVMHTLPEDVPAPPVYMPASPVYIPKPYVMPARVSGPSLPASVPLPLPVVMHTFPEDMPAPESSFTPAVASNPFEGIPKEYLIGGAGLLVLLVMLKR